MTLIELKLEILKIATPLALSTVGDNFEMVVDGKLTDQEKLANLEPWERLKVFAAGIASGLLPENRATFGFERIQELLGESTVGGVLRDAATESLNKLKESIPNPGD